MSDGVLRCEECKETKELLQAFKGRFLCAECYFVAEPPRMSIAKILSPAYQNGHRLFNQTLNCYENTMTIEMFLTCGWFLRRIRERASLIIYELEYYGKKKCLRCGDIRFPKSFDRCVNSALCQFTPRKTEVTRPEIYLG